MICEKPLQAMELDFTQKKFAERSYRNDLPKIYLCRMTLWRFARIASKRWWQNTTVISQKLCLFIFARYVLLFNAYNDCWRAGRTGPINKLMASRKLSMPSEKRLEGMPLIVWTPRMNSLHFAPLARPFSFTFLSSPMKIYSKFALYWYLFGPVTPEAFSKLSSLNIFANPVSDSDPPCRVPSVLTGECVIFFVFQKSKQKQDTIDWKTLLLIHNENVKFNQHEMQFNHCHRSTDSV